MVFFWLGWTTIDFTVLTIDCISLHMLLCAHVYFIQTDSQVELMSQRELPFHVDRLLNYPLKVFNNIHFHR